MKGPRRVAGQGETRGKTVEEIIEAYKDKLTKGELQKLTDQVQKLRGQRNKNKDSRKK